MTDIESAQNHPLTMDPEDKARWIDALRSGMFHQGEGILRRKQNNDAVRHCCLGVYAEVCGMPFTPLTSPIDIGGVGYFFRFPDSQGQYTTTLPDYWSEQRGISAENQNKLIRMNDQDGYSFAEIADWIDEHL